MLHRIGDRGLSVGPVNPTRVADGVEHDFARSGGLGVSGRTALSGSTRLVAVCNGNGSKCVAGLGSATGLPVVRRVLLKARVIALRELG
jgi:hypothetical protein